MTKILLITIGSRGDIQPFVALGKGLQAAGYTVALQTAAA
jgi:sterol 3beta-glucosyltransferase